MIEVRGLKRTFRGRRGRPDVHALAGVDLDVRPGERLVVVGPSGSGKTTLLRAIAGLEPVDAGSISIDGRDISRLPAGARDVAMLFQDSALYPHLDVLANIMFGLRARRVPRQQAAEAAERAAAILGIDGLVRRRPHELSGGERQRVALARAIVREPSVFLLDEPLSSLDAQIRDQARQEIRAVQRRLGRSMVMVTHDDLDAMALGDRVAVLHAGRVVQVDEPAAVYDRPATPFAARLLGRPAINLVAPEALGLRCRDGAAGVVGIRPEHLLLVTPAAGRVAGHVEVIEHLGSDLVVHVRVCDETLRVRVGRGCAVSVGDEVGIDVGGDTVLCRRGRWSEAGRAAVYLPTIIPDIAYALLWAWLLNPYFGPVAVVAAETGLPSPGWLTDPWAARVAIAAMGGLQVGEGFLIALAWRRMIPAHLYEAAEVEGARPTYVMRHVTLPLMSPVLALLALRDVLLVLQLNFVPARFVTDGGPRRATTYLPGYLYDHAFRYFRLGYASAVALTMLVATGLVLYLQYRVVRRWRLL